MREWLVKPALSRIVDDLMIDLRWNALENNSRQNDTVVDAFSHQRNGLVHVIRKGAEPGQPIIVIFECVKGQGVGQFVCGLDSAVLVQGHQIPAKLMALDFILVLLFEKVVIELIRR